jgi:hypothetical protein
VGCLPLIYVKVNDVETPKDFNWNSAVNGTCGSIVVKPESHGTEDTMR